MGLLQTLGLIAPKVRVLETGEAAPPAAGDGADSPKKKGIVELQKRLDLLGPALARANDSPVPPFIDNWQRMVRETHAELQAKLAANDLAGAENAYSMLGARLDTLDKFKRNHADFEARFKAAKNGPVKAALALKLTPADLANSRTKALEQHEAEIRRLADSGALVDANSKLAEWAAEARAWGKAKTAYDNLHGKDPDAGTLDDLSDAPGGAAVLDALVADLPDDVPNKVMAEAMKARYDVELTEYNHREGKGTNKKADSKELNPKTPDKALKGLYKVLGKVPLNDVKEVEEIVHYAFEDDKEGKGASYQGGVFNDTVKLYCGRPDDGNEQDFNKPGEVVPHGEKVDPRCEPVNPEIKVPYFDMAALHEVGHAVDDAKNVMKGGRSKDADWQTHGTGHISKLVAGKFGYDADYIEDMMDSKTCTPPKKKPQPPEGVKAADWERQRVRVEAWVTFMRAGAGPWWNAAVCKSNEIGGRVYHEAYEGDWVSYKLAARAQGITGYQFRSPAEWFAELYAAYYSKKLNPKHPAASWLKKLKAESTAD